LSAAENAKSGFENNKKQILYGIAHLMLPQGRYQFGGDLWTSNSWSC